MLALVVSRSVVGKVRPAGQIQPASSVYLAHGGSSVLALNPARVLPPNALKDEWLFTCRARFTLTLLIDADWLSDVGCRVDADKLPYTLAVLSLVQ